MMTDTIDAFADRKRAAVASLDGLRQKIGVALLDSGAPPAGAAKAIGDAELEVQLILVAEGEAVRRKRSVQAAAEAEARVLLRGQLAEYEVARVAAIERAEAAARVLCDELHSALASVGKIREAVKTLGERLPGNIEPSDMELRLSRRLAALLIGVSANGARDRFGMITWRRGFFEKAADCWADFERAEGERTIAPLTRENEKPED